MNDIRTRLLRCLVILLALIPLSGLGAHGPEQQQLIVIRNINVIDVRAGRVLPVQTVLVRDGRIAAVERGSGARIPDAARIIDGSGKYLLPGLWDMHAHPSNKAAADIDMPVYLAHGVTGARVMQTWTECPAPIAGDACLDEQKEWQRRVLAGALAGPRIVGISSNLLNGPPAPGSPRRSPSFLNQETADDGRQLARYLKDRGVDFIKICNEIPRETYLALLEEARRIGLPAAGHKPNRIPALEVSGAGQRSVEHIQSLQLDCWRGAEAFRSDPASVLSPVILQRMITEYDETICGRIFQTFIKNRTWFTPTHVVRRSEAYAEQNARGEDPRAKFVTSERWTRWVTGAERLAARDTATRMNFYLKGLELTGQAHRAGVRILVGTDAGVPFVFKGSSLHEELEELVKAGLPISPVLKAATLDAAEFLGRTSDFGTVEAGKMADLILLEANPLTDVRNTQRIYGVLLQGRHFDRSALDQLLAKASAAAGR